MVFPALDEAQLQATGRYLERGPDLLIFISSKKLGRPIPQSLHPMAPIAYELAWTHGPEPGATLTPLGELVGDSCREYVHWQERGRTIHGQNDYAALHPENMKGRRVLELGCGSGINLLTLSQHIDDLVGVDVVPLYLQMAQLLFAMERLPPPKLIAAGAEQIPLENSSRDVIIIFGALQYTDIDQVLRECHRVLDRDGQLITINGHFLAAVRETLHNIASLRLRGTYTWLTTLANTVSYQLTRKRLQRGSDASSTSVPVYPAIDYLKSSARAAGLIVDPASHRTGQEYMLIARKP